MVGFVDSGEEGEKERVMTKTTKEKRHKQQQQQPYLVMQEVFYLNFKLIWNICFGESVILLVHEDCPSGK